MDLQVFPLHKYPQYSIQCCKLINDEWKRSDTARMRSLESSCDTLPTCLIMLKEDKVIGHCKISVIPSIRTACFIESVVIEKSLRGKGYGSYLMTKSEEYCKNILHSQTIYLSTKDQESFYTKLGYCKCEPISIYGNGSNLTNLSTRVVQQNQREHLNKGRIPSLPPAITWSSSGTTKTYMKKDL